MSDIARRLGETLLGAEKLLPSQVQAAIVAAREEKRYADLREEIEKIAVRLRLCVRIRDDVRMMVELRRIAKELQEIVE